MQKAAIHSSPCGGQGLYPVLPRGPLPSSASPQDCRKKRTNGRRRLQSHTSKLGARRSRSPLFPFSPTADGFSPENVSLARSSPGIAGAGETQPATVQSLRYPLYAIFLSAEPEETARQSLPRHHLRGRDTTNRSSRPLLFTSNGEERNV